MNNQFHANDTAAQQALRVEALEIYRDLFAMTKTLSRAEMLKQLTLAHDYLAPVMEGVVDNQYDQYDMDEAEVERHTQYGASIGLDHMMPIGKYLVRDLQRAIKSYQ